MANKKFSEFVLKTSTSDVSHIVGYNGAENVQITPANFVTGGGTGVFLPLAGGTMTGTIVQNGGNIDFSDGRSANFGSGDDLQIYHDGSNSYIKDVGTGDFRIWADNPNISSLSGNKYFYGNNGSAELYHSGNKKLETTSTGISVTGGGVFTGSLASVSIGTTGNDISFSRNSDNYINAAGGTSSNIVLNPLNRFVVNTDNAERMRIDSSGNLCLGLTSTNYRMEVQSNSGESRLLHLKNPSNNYGESSIMRLGTETTDNFGAEIGFYRGTSSNADRGLFLDGSGTGSQQVKLLTNGNLGIGTSSPSEKLTVESGAGFIATFKSLTASDFRPIRFQNAAGNDVGYLGNDDSTDDFFLRANDQPLVFGSGSSGAERMRIDASGNVGVGTATPRVQTEIYGTGQLTSAISDSGNTGATLSLSSNSGSAGSGGCLLFAALNDSGNTKPQASIKSLLTNGSLQGVGDLAFSTRASTSDAVLTERMRITSAGDLLVGTTTSFALATHDPNVITNQSFGVSDGTNNSTIGLDRIHFDSSNYFVLNGSAIGVKLVNGATAWAAQSDESLKENIKPLENVLDKIKDYRCVEYNLKAEKTDKKIGFIAQDWEQDFDAIVDKDADGILSMKYTETIPVLLKAIQELSAKLEALECQCEKK